MARILSCLFLLFGFLFVNAPACECKDTTADVTETGEPLKFKNGIWVYLAHDTSADRAMLEISEGKETVFTDPDGNNWRLQSASGFTVMDFMEDDYEDAWFQTSSGQGQRFFCKFIPGQIYADEDLYLPEPARCSVYIDGGHNYYAYLGRMADSVTCPTVSQYKKWLPQVVSHAVPLYMP